VVMNVDVGGATSKIGICAGGKVVALTALDVGARLICLDAEGRIARVEEAGMRFGAQLGIALDIGRVLEPDAARALAACMADGLFAAMHGGTPAASGAKLLRLDPLPVPERIDAVTFSGGVSEYIYGWEKKNFDDLGMLLAAEIGGRAARWGPRLQPPSEGIRATVIGASQYTTQVSGGTIFVSPLNAVPLRNVPVIAPDFVLDREAIEPAAVASAIRAVLRQLDLADGESAVAIFVAWRGSATFQRLDAFCRGVVDGLAVVLARGHPIVLAGDGDVGGLIGIHLREEMKIANPIISVDGLELKEFDYVDIGAMFDSSGAVPVVIKSLVFPASDQTGRRQPDRSALSPLRRERPLAEN